MLQNFVVGSFTSSSWSDNHETMSNLDGIIKLHDFLVEKFNLLHIVELAGFSDSCSKVSIVDLWSFNTWEQIQNNILEQWNIIFQELRDIDISESSEKELMLV
jgi:hypothetical protein